MKRRVMRKFGIDELSGVDRPAQEGAGAVIMKRADGIEKFGVEDFGNPKMLSDEDGHTHLIDDRGKAGETTWQKSEGEDGGHTHPWVRSREGGVIIGMAEGHDHSVVEKKLTDSELKKALEQETAKAAKPMEGKPMGDEGKTAEAETKAQIEDLTKRLEKSEAVGTMTDAQKAFYAALDEGSQTTYLAKSADDKNADIEKAKGDDPVVYTADNGTDYRKSDDPRMTKMARERDEDRRELVAEKAARKRDTFLKRAGEELANLPGNETVKVSLLTAIDSIGDEDTRKGISELLKAANEGVTKAFSEAGTIEAGTGSAAEAEGKLAKMAEELAKTDSIPYAKAYQKVLTSPEGRELYKETTA